MGPSLPLCPTHFPQKSMHHPIHTSICVPICSHKSLRPNCAPTQQASVPPRILTGYPTCVPWCLCISQSCVSLCFCTSVHLCLPISERSPFGNQENVRWRKSITHWKQTSDRVDKYVLARSGPVSRELAPQAPEGGGELCRRVGPGFQRLPCPLLSPSGPRMKWNRRPWWKGTWQPR